MVPQTIGRACFLDKITNIDAGMVPEAVSGLQRYAGQFSAKDTVIRSEFGKANLLSTMNRLACWKTEPRRITTAAIIGASGDVGAQFAIFLTYKAWRLSVLCEQRR